MLFEIQVHDLDGWRIVAPVGELDLADAPTLRARVLRELAAGHRRVLIDLAGLDFLDSVGAGILVALNKRATATGVQLALARPEPQVRRVLELAGVDRILPVHAELGGSGGVGTTPAAGRPAGGGP